MLIKLFNKLIKRKPKIKYINVMYECILVKDGIIKCTDKRSRNERNRI